MKNFRGPARPLAVLGPRENLGCQSPLTVPEPRVNLGSRQLLTVPEPRVNLGSRQPLTVPEPRANLGSRHPLTVPEPQRRLAVRKGDFGDNGRTTLSTSGVVELITAGRMHQKSSPYDDARGSYLRYPIAIAPPSKKTTSRRGRAISHEAVRKDDFVDNAPTTLNISGNVRLITAGYLH